MQILSKSFILPQNTRNINKDSKQTQMFVTPSFKSSKTKVVEGLANEIKNGIKFDGAMVKEILADSKKRTVFFEMLGATILATVANLVNAIDDTKDEGSGHNQQAAGLGKMETISQEIKFDTTRGIAPKVEKDFISFVNDNFAEDKITSDRLKLLFNKFAAHNRNGSHVLGEEVKSNREILSLILDELTQAKSEKDKINDIINKYQGLVNINAPVTSTSSQVEVVEVEVSQDIKSILDRFALIKTKYFEIMHSCKNKKEAKELLKPINIFLLEASNVDRVLNSVNHKNYNDKLQKLAELLNQASKDEKEKLYEAIKLKSIKPEAIENWNEHKKVLNCDFSMYNEFVNANIDIESMKKLVEIYNQRGFSKIKVFPEESKMYLAVSDRISVNQNFVNIKKLFELVQKQTVNLRGDDDIKFDEKTLTDVLKEDYKHNGKSTYESIVKYIYGPNFKINNESSFDYKKMDYRLNLLLDIINKEDVLNPKLFSPHAKLRFLERFVLNENFGTKSLYSATKSKVKSFVLDLKDGFRDGIIIDSYTSPAGTVGAHIVVKTRSGDVEITLDDKSKIHTIF